MKLKKSLTCKVNDPPASRCSTTGRSTFSNLLQQLITRSYFKSDIQQFLRLKNFSIWLKIQDVNFPTARFHIWPTCVKSRCKWEIKEGCCSHVTSFQRHHSGTRVCHMQQMVEKLSIKQVFPYICMTVHPLITTVVSLVSIFTSYHLLSWCFR